MSGDAVTARPGYAIHESEGLTVEQTPHNEGDVTAREAARRHAQTAMVDLKQQTGDERGEYYTAGLTNWIPTLTDDIDALLAELEAAEAERDEWMQRAATVGIDLMVADNRAEASDAWAARLEGALRRELWTHHGCDVSALYGDDGEMQCGNGHPHHPMLDFKRQPIEELLETVRVARLSRAALSSSDGEGQDAE